MFKGNPNVISAGNRVSISIFNKRSSHKDRYQNGTKNLHLMCEKERTFYETKKDVVYDFGGNGSYQLFCYWNSSGICY